MSSPNRRSAPTLRSHTHKARPKLTNAHRLKAQATPSDEDLGAAAVAVPKADPVIEDDQRAVWIRLGLQKSFKCGLCEMAFQCEKGSSVTRKAVDDVRTLWAAGASANGNKGTRSSPVMRGHSACDDATAARSAIASLYRPVPVCRFCAQFFGVHYGSSFDTNELPASHALRNRHVRSPGGRGNTVATSDDDRHAFEASTRARVSVFPHRTRRGTSLVDHRKFRRAPLSTIEAIVDASPSPSPSSIDDTYSDEESGSYASSGSSAAQPVAPTNDASRQDVPPSSGDPALTDARRNAPRVSYSRYMRIQSSSSQSETKGAIYSRLRKTSRRAWTAAPSQRPVPDAPLTVNDVFVATGLRFTVKDNGHVEVVRATGRARHGGLKQGQRIIRIGDVDVSTMEGVVAAIASHPVDTPLLFRVHQDGEEKELWVMVGQHHAAEPIEFSIDEHDASDERASSPVTFAPMTPSPRPVAIKEEEPLQRFASIPQRSRMTSRAITVVLLGTDATLPHLPQYVTQLVAAQVMHWASSVALDDAPVTVTSLASDALAEVARQGRDTWVNLVLLGHCSYSGNAVSDALQFHAAPHTTPVSRFIEAVDRNGTGCGMIIVDSGFSPALCPPGGEECSVAVVTAGPDAAKLHPIGGLTLSILSLAARMAADSSPAIAPYPALLRLLELWAESLLAITSATGKKRGHQRSAAPVEIGAHLPVGFAARTGFAGRLSDPTEYDVNSSKMSARQLHGVTHIVWLSSVFTKIIPATTSTSMVLIFSVAPVELCAGRWNGIAAALARRRCNPSSIDVVCTAYGPGVVVRPKIAQRALDDDSVQEQEDSDSTAFAVLLKDFASGHLRLLAGIPIRAVGLMMTRPKDDLQDGARVIEALRIGPAMQVCKDDDVFLDTVAATTEQSVM